MTSGRHFEIQNMLFEPGLWLLGLPILALLFPEMVRAETATTTKARVDAKDAGKPSLTVANCDSESLCHCLALSSTSRSQGDHFNKGNRMHFAFFANRRTAGSVFLKSILSPYVGSFG